MSDTNTRLGLPEAAARLGVSLRTLRQAIRAGAIPAPANLTATSPLSPDWLAQAQSAAVAHPALFKHHTRQKVPAFARYEGTSAWRKYSHRVREYNHFRAHTATKAAAAS